MYTGFPLPHSWNPERQLFISFGILNAHVCFWSNDAEIQNERVGAQDTLESCDRDVKRVYLIRQL
jgi:hypothetical protein